MYKSRNLKSSISVDINFTYVYAKEYSLKYIYIFDPCQSNIMNAYMTQYDRRKLRLPELITREIN